MHQESNSLGAGAVKPRPASLALQASQGFESGEAREREDGSDPACALQILFE
jgi:hypothetical protein